MEEFISAKVLLSLPGCITIVVFSTQLFKKYFKNTKSKTIALILSVIIAIGRIFALGEFDIPSIIIGIINTLPILWGATSAYDTMTKSKTKAKVTADNNAQQPGIITETEVIKETNVIETNVIKQVQNNEE